VGGNDANIHKIRRSLFFRTFPLSPSHPRSSRFWPRTTRIGAWVMTREAPSRRYALEGREGGRRGRKVRSEADDRQSH